MKLNELHDAVLGTIRVDYDRETVTMLLRPCQFPGRPKKIAIIAHGWQRFVCPRELPWGHSATTYINEVRGPINTDERLDRLEFELQTGDTVQISAARFTWKIVDDEDSSSPEQPIGQPLSENE